MKTVFIVALILFAGNVWADENEVDSLITDENSPDSVDTSSENPNNVDSAEDDGEFTEAATNDLEQALKDSSITNTIKGEGISIGLTKGNDIVIRLGGGAGGGRGYGGPGVTYTRWGRRSCPPKATLVYEGYAGAGGYNQKGNGANYLCMPRDPQYLSSTNVPYPSYLYGAEYETGNKVFSRTTHDYNVPCAVCHVRKSTKIMIPGRYSCPSSWTREYFGYIMTSHHSHPQTIQYECVDSTPDLIPGSQSNRNGALFYFVEAVCNHGLPCGPYVARKAVTCAICTK